MASANQPADMAPGTVISANALGGHWRLFLIEGIVLAVLGAIAIVLPQVASLTIALFLGWLLLIGGGIGFATTLMARSAPAFWWALASAGASIVAGAVLVAWPIGGIVYLTFILATFLVADGFIMIMFGVEHRRQLSQRWGWLVLNGLLDLLFATIVVVALPGSAGWALGLVVGFDMLLGGSSLIAMALKARPN